VLAVATPLAAQAAEATLDHCLLTAVEAAVDQVALLAQLANMVQQVAAAVAVALVELVVFINTPLVAQAVMLILLVPRELAAVAVEEAAVVLLALAVQVFLQEAAVAVDVALLLVLLVPQVEQVFLQAVAVAQERPMQEAAQVAAEESLQ
jgi:hypothetical protein